MLLAACGGGGGDSPSQAPSNPPVSGRLDGSYGTGGKVTFSPSDFLSSMAVKPDGSVYLAGLSVAKLDANRQRVQPYGEPPNERIGRLSSVVDGAGNQLSDAVTFTVAPSNPNREVYIAWIRTR